MTLATPSPHRSRARFARLTHCDARSPMSAHGGAPTGKRRLCTAHTHNGRSRRRNRGLLSGHENRDQGVRRFRWRFTSDAKRSRAHRCARRMRPRWPGPAPFLVRLGRVAAPAPRQNARSRRRAGGASQRFVRCAKKQRVGLPLGLVPILVEQRPLDRVAPEPEMVVADGAFLEQRLSGGQRRCAYPRPTRADRG